VGEVSKKAEAQGRACKELSFDSTPHPKVSSSQREERSSRARATTRVEKEREAKAKTLSGQQVI
jgi:hypothetical protein